MNEYDENEIEEIVVKGIPGKTPIKGEDYFTAEEIKEVADMATPKKMELTIPGIEIMKLVGPKGAKGEKGDKGDKGIDGRNGYDGKDGKDGSPDKPEDIAKKLNTLEGKIERKVIKGLEKMVEKDTLDRAISILDQRTQFLINKQTTSTGGGGGGTWGSITGTLSDQTDLQAALDLKVPTSRTLTINGTAYDLSADRIWSVGTVTSVAALTLGTTGTDLSSSVATGTTTPVITLNVPTASATNRGALSSTDWTTFNNKFTLPSLTSGSVLFSNGTTIAQDNSNFFWDDTNNRLGIGTTTPTYIVHIKSPTTTNDAIEISAVSNSATTNLTTRNTGAQGNYLTMSTFGSTVVGTSSGIARAGLTEITSNNNTAFIFRGIANVPLYWATNDIVRMTILGNGRVGIGTTSPTAMLHLPAGTATASTAPLKFTTGTNLTTPEAGAIEYNGTQLYFSPSTTRNILAQVSGGTALTTGSIPFATTSGYLTQDNANLFFDDTNNRLGIGTNSPSYLAHLYFDSATPNGLYIYNNENYTGTSNAFISIRNGQFAGSNTDWSINTHRWNNSNSYLQNSAYYKIGSYAGSIDSRHIFQMVTGSADNNSYFSIVKQGTPSTSTELFRVNTLGNVGVGTSSPSEKLHLYAVTGNAKELIEVAGGATVAFNIKSGSNTWSLAHQNNFHSGNLLLNFGGTDYTSNALEVSTTGQFGFGVASPTAVLHLKAGTATASTAPLKFNTGSFNTTAEAGAVEFLAERFTVTPTSTARQALPGIIFTQTADGTVANTVTETALIGTGVAVGGGLTLPANFFVAGKTLRITTKGFHSSTGSPTIRIRVKLGSVTVLDTGTHSSHNDTNALFEVEGIITCRTTGGTGTVYAQGIYEEVGAVLDRVAMVNTATTTIDTTASQAVSITVEWGTADVGNTITSTNTILEVLN